MAATPFLNSGSSIPMGRWTREAWLEEGTDHLRPRFAAIGMPLPDLIHISVGFGYGAKRESKKLLGQCFATWKSADGINHVFISPELSDTARVLDVLLHELVHVADDCENGHRKPFADAAKALGLVGKMTETTAGEALADEMFLLATELGHYPHGRLEPSRVPSLTPVGPGGETIPVPRGFSGPAKQGTRQLKAMCPIDGYTVRVSRKWLDLGNPSCPFGHEMTEA